MAADANSREDTNRPGEPAAGTGGGDPKRVLFNVGHPAQVHLFRHVIAELQARGHETLVASRHKEMTTDLLDAFGIEHVPVTAQRDSLPGLAFEQLQRERRMLEIAREFDPDVVVSRLAPAPVHVAKLYGCASLVVCDTDRGSKVMRKLNHALTLRFVDAICVPDQFDLPVADEKRKHLPFQELAYLHPHYFTPDPGVLESHGIDPDEPFYVLRLTGWDAYHDAGHVGISPAGQRELVEFLADHGSVYVSAEDGLPDDLPAEELTTPPEDVHHVLYYADMYLGDSGTMSAEAAILGTPAIRTNSLVGTTGEMIYGSLEHDYGLLQSIADEDDAIAAAKELVTDPPDEREIRRRRSRMLDDQQDVTRELLRSILEVTGAADNDRVEVPATDD